ncbi:MAG TPA: gamma-glutamyltransferase, partial [bacterium]|nr:gamma-glutamyltransferase [bacterium]
MKRWPNMFCLPVLRIAALSRRFGEGLACAAGLALAASIVSCAGGGDEALKPLTPAVATADARATQAGIAILEAGGNAFDAAVAVTAMLAVVEPFNSGLGGGGFYLLHRAADDFQVVVDAREAAPFAATATMYLDVGGRIIQKKSLDGPLAAAIPGTP